MIDWTNLLLNSSWIFGCALALAALSYASWDSSISKEKLLVCLGKSKIQLTLNISGVFFCVGLAGTSDVSWQRILWILLALGFLVQIVIGTSQVLKNDKSQSE
jgi:hypothetical protein